jgi:hypothetical protein
VATQQHSIQTRWARLLLIHVGHIVIMIVAGMQIVGGVGMSVCRVATRRGDTGQVWAMQRFSKDSHEH